MKYTKILFILVLVTGSFLHAIEYTRVILAVDGDGETVMNINDTKVSKETGIEKLNQLRKLRPGETIKIIVTPEVKTQDLFKFITQVQNAGLENIDVALQSKADDEFSEQSEIIVLKLQKKIITIQIIQSDFKKYLE